MDNEGKGDQSRVAANQHSQSLRVGYYHEITEDISPIPKGIYRLTDRAADCLMFSVGKKVGFSITGFWQNKVKVVPQTYALLHRTNQANFLDRYYELMNNDSRKLRFFDPSKPITMCFVDPSVAREIN